MLLARPQESLPLDVPCPRGDRQREAPLSAEPDSRVSQVKREIAGKTAAKLSLEAKDYAAKLPRIMSENTCHGAGRSFSPLPKLRRHHGLCAVAPIWSSFLEPSRC